MRVVWPTVICATDAGRTDHTRHVMHSDTAFWLGEESAAVAAVRTHSTVGFKLASVGQQRLSVGWCKGDVHTSVPRSVPYIPPSLAFHLRAPLPSLGSPSPIGPRGRTGL